MKLNEMFSKAKWIYPDLNSNYAYIKDNFEKKSNKATIKVCGLGFFELYINGKKVSDDLFTPVTSDYHHNENAHCVKEFGEQLEHRIYVLEYDISSYLIEGENCIGVFVGGGFYTFDSFGEIKAIWEITFSNGDVAYSSENAVCASCNVCSGNIMGEVQDDKYYIENWSTIDCDKGEWKAVSLCDAFDTNYYIQNCPSDGVRYSIYPRLINSTDEYDVYDIGENVSARVVFKVREKANITLLHSELKTKDNEIDMDRHWEQKSTFNCSNTNKEYYTIFTWNAFRYFQISKGATVLRVDVINIKMDVSSDFTCDNKVVNWFYKAYLRTQLANIHAGIPSDCPHIERRGYTGDGQLTCDTVMHLFDAKAFYRKWIDDISDCQDRKTGHVQYTAPYAHCGGGPGGWGIAIIEVPYTYYKNYGDKKPLIDMYEQMKHYTNYLENHSENDLVVSDQPGLWCLGEWCTPSQIGASEVEIPESYVNNYFYIKSLQRLIEIAKIIGKESDIQEFERIIKIKSLKIMECFYNEETCDFVGNSHCANCYALDIGLGNEKTLANLVNHCDTLGYFDTGIFATDIVMNLLFKNNYASVAYKLISSEGKCSYGNMMNNGACSIWEYWTGERSHDHPMFGTPAKYLLTYVLGIRQQADSKNFEEIIIAPAKIDAINETSGYMTTPQGKISVSYKKNADSIVFDIDVQVDSVVFSYDGYVKKLNRGAVKINLPIN